MSKNTTEQKEPEPDELVEFICPSCGKILTIPFMHVGKSGICNKCNNKILPDFVSLKGTIGDKKRRFESKINVQTKNSELPALWERLDAPNTISQEDGRNKKEMAEKSLPLGIGLNILLPGVGYAYYGREIGVLIAVGLVIFFFVICLSGNIQILFLLGPFHIFLQIIMALDMLHLSTRYKKELVEYEALKLKYETKDCPNCAERIKKEAKICRFCGTHFDSGQSS